MFPGYLQFDMLRATHSMFAEFGSMYSVPGLTPRATDAGINRRNRRVLTHMGNESTQGLRVRVPTGPGFMVKGWGRSALPGGHLGMMAQETWTEEEPISKHRFMGYPGKGAMLALTLRERSTRTGRTGCSGTDAS